MELAQPQQSFPPLPCSTIVYRAMLRRQWIEKRTNRITSAAFIKRPRERGGDDAGLSVGIANRCTLEAFRCGFTACYGVTTLHVGRIRDIDELDVEQDEPAHANITGLPYKEDHEAEAERLAGLL